MQFDYFFYCYYSNIGYKYQIFTALLVGQSVDQLYKDETLSFQGAEPLHPCFPLLVGAQIPATSRTVKDPSEEKRRGRKRSGQEEKAESVHVGEAVQEEAGREKGRHGGGRGGGGNTWQQAAASPR